MCVCIVCRWAGLLVMMRCSRWGLPHEGDYVLLGMETRCIPLKSAGKSCWGGFPRRFGWLVPITCREGFNVPGRRRRRRELASEDGLIVTQWLGGYLPQLPGISLQSGDLCLWAFSKGSRINPTSKTHRFRELESPARFGP